MTRLFIAVVIGLTISVCAAVAPATRAAGDLSPEESHRQAVELMNAGQFDKASPLFDKIFKATAQQQRSRALILNRAILDIAQKRLVMRAVRDVSEYLRANRGEDEYATNVLAVAMNLAAENPRWKQSPVWQNAFKEWDRRNYLLDHSRKGWRRWGARWISEEEFKTIENRKEDLRRAMEAQSDRVNRAVLSVRSLMQQQQNAYENQAAFNYLRQNMDYIQKHPNSNIRQRLSAQHGETRMAQEELNAWAAVQELGGEIAVAVRELSDEQAALGKLRQELTAIRPDWPTRMAPIDPDAPPPTRLAPATTGSSESATQPAQPDAPLTPQDLYGPPATEP